MFLRMGLSSWHGEGVSMLASPGVVADLFQRLTLAYVRKWTQRLELWALMGLCGK